jgi:molybdate transport system substrate-binding protein
MVARIQRGEVVDVAVVTTPQMEKLVIEGKITPGTQVSISRSGMGLGAPKGAAKSDIGSRESLQQVLSAAKSIGHTDPAGGASSAIYAAQLLARLDNAAELIPKIRTFASNGLLLEAVSNGEVELGFGQMSEILAAPGVDLVAPLPASVQHYSRYSAAVPASAKERDAGKAFISFLGSPAALAIMKAKGIDAPEAQ